MQIGITWAARMVACALLLLAVGCQQKNTSHPDKSSNPFGMESPFKEGGGIKETAEFDPGNSALGRERAIGDRAKEVLPDMGSGEAEVGNLWLVIFGALLIIAGYFTRKISTIIGWLLMIIGTGITAWGLGGGLHFHLWPWGTEGITHQLKWLLVVGAFGLMWAIPTSWGDDVIPGGVAIGGMVLSMVFISQGVDWLGAPAWWAAAIVAVVIGHYIRKSGTTGGQIFLSLIVAYSLAVLA